MSIVTMAEVALLGRGRISEVQCGQVKANIRHQCRAIEQKVG